MYRSSQSINWQRLHKLNDTLPGIDIDLGASLPRSKIRHHLNSYSDSSNSKSNSNTNTEDMVDILQIDTEGHDAEVLKSARRLIQGHRVRALIFEYHGYKPWADTMLKEVLLTITTHHMVCYYMGQKRLWPISNTCWHDRYETHQWSNIMCVLKSDLWYKAIQPLVMTVDAMRAKVLNGSVIDAFRYQELDLIRDNKTQVAVLCEQLPHKMNVSSLAM